MSLISIIALLVSYFLVRATNTPNKNKSFGILGAAILILVSGLRNEIIGSDTRNYISFFAASFLPYGDFAEGINYCMHKDWGYGVLERVNNALIDQMKQRNSIDPLFQEL